MVWRGTYLAGKTVLTLLMRASKSNTKHTVKTTCRIFCFSDFKSTLEMKEGLFSKIPLQHTKQEELINDTSSKFMAPELSQMDCSIWSMLESRICSKRHSIFGVHGNKSLLEEQAKLSGDELRPVAEHFFKDFIFTYTSESCSFSVNDIFKLFVLQSNFDICDH